MKQVIPDLSDDRPPVHLIHRSNYYCVSHALQQLLKFHVDGKLLIDRSMGMLPLCLPVCFCAIVVPVRHCDVRMRDCGWKSPP
jgi:hypothetical protein